MNAHPAPSDVPVAPAAQADFITVAALAALAYLIAVGLHEHAGHTLACLALGSHPTALGAFYVDCADQGLGDLARRAVALAGPLVSLLLGLACRALLPRLAGRGTAPVFLCWLLGSLGLMSATGYLLFSGASGLGDLGTTSDGALHGVPQPLLARLALFGAGAWSYRQVMRGMRRSWQRCFGPTTASTSAWPLERRITLLSYLTGALLYLAIGVLNPKGLEILLTSVLPSSLGASYGLLGMWRMRLPVSLADGDAPASAPPPFRLPRQGGWLLAALVAAVAYALAFGAG